MSYINRFLKSAGVNTPYQSDNRTEAQIGEANKSNPLSGFGFMSAQQKSQRDLQMKLFEAQQSREQEMMQQQLIARMSSQEKIGHYAGTGLMGLMQHLQSKGQAPQVPNAPQDDPQVTRFNELAVEVGPEMAMQILGQEQGNAGMTQQAQTMRAERQKTELEAKYKTSQIDEASAKLNDPNRGYEHKPGYTDEEDVDFNGKPGIRRRILIKNTPEGGEWKYGAPALKGSVTDPKAWDTSKGGINERTRAMEGALTATANSMDVYDRLEKLAQDTPAGLGWTGKLASNADVAVSGIKNLADALAAADGQKVTAAFDVSKYDFSKLDKVAGASDKIKSLLVQLAYSQAAANGDSSRSISDRDIQNQIDAIGGSIANPKNFLELVKQNKELMVGKLENMAKYSRIDGAPIFEAYRKDIEGLKGRAGVKSATPSYIDTYGSEEAAIKRLRELEARHSGGTQ